MKIKEYIIQSLKYVPTKKSKEEFIVKSILHSFSPFILPVILLLGYYKRVILETFTGEKAVIYGGDFDNFKKCFLRDGVQVSLVFLVYLALYSFIGSFLILLTLNNFNFYVNIIFNILSFLLMILLIYIGSASLILTVRGDSIKKGFNIIKLKFLLSNRDYLKSVTASLIILFSSLALIYIMFKLALVFLSTVMFYLLVLPLLFLSNLLLFYAEISAFKSISLGYLEFKNS